MGRTWRKNSDYNKKSFRDEQRLLKKKREKIQKRLKLPDESIPEPRWIPEQKKER